MQVRERVHRDQRKARVLREQCGRCHPAQGRVRAPSRLRAAGQARRPEEAGGEEQGREGVLRHVVEDVQRKRDQQGRHAQPQELPLGPVGIVGQRVAQEEIGDENQQHHEDAVQSAHPVEEPAASEAQRPAHPDPRPHQRVVDRRLKGLQVGAAFEELAVRLDGPARGFGPALPGRGRRLAPLPRPHVVLGRAPGPGEGGHLGLVGIGAGPRQVAARVLECHVDVPMLVYVAERGKGRREDENPARGQHGQCDGDSRLGSSHAPEHGRSAASARRPSRSAVPVEFWDTALHDPTLPSHPCVHRGARNTR